ncbi:MAG: M48 family metallopeptidase [Myxococcota bacterium]
MSSSLWRQALLAVGLTVGFYLLALTVIVGLVGLPVLEWVAADRIHLKLVVVCWAAAGVIGWSIVPRPERYQAPGPTLSRDAHPALFAEIDGIAAAARQAGPAEVYLMPDVNAFVAQVGGVVGLGSRRVMGLGLPLLQVLTVSQLRAVLAHEFGHYHGGETALGPWVYHSRASMARTVNNLAGHPALEVLSAPFRWYAQLFLRITLAVSRSQEHAADLVAARVAGARSTAEALERLRGSAHAFEQYLGQELEPVLAAGYLPPVGAGFATFLERPRIVAAVQRQVARDLAEEQVSPFDTHPPLRDRLNALRGLPELADPPDLRSAVELLGDVASAERALLRHLDLRPIGWDEVGERVVVPKLLSLAQLAGALAGHTVREVGQDPTSWVALGATLAPGADANEHLELGGRLIQCAVLARLVSDGWAIRSLPGEPHTATLGGLAFAPGPLLAEVEQRGDPSTWIHAVDAVGIGDLRLGEPPTTAGSPPPAAAAP